MIFPARLKDINSIARIHAEAMPDTVMTLAGKETLRKIYLSLLNNKSAMLLVITVNEKVVGVISVVTSYPFKMDNQTKILVIKNLLLRPFAPGGIRDRVMMLFGLRGEYRREPWIMTVAIDPKMQGRGLGSKLILEVTNQLRKMGKRTVLLDTQYNNVQAISFYEKMGFEHVKRIGHDVIMRKIL